jgi:drug/metabolite transporter (DMT)-like permease
VAVLGFSGYYLASYLDFLGLMYITAGLERLILFLHPTIVVLLSAWWLKKPVRTHHFIALALSYGGIALVFTENLNFGGQAHDVALGGALVFVSGAIYAFYFSVPARSWARSVRCDLRRMRCWWHAWFACCNSRLRMQQSRWWFQRRSTG